MSINLEFTKDSQWIERRESIWEKIKESYSSEITRKQRDTLREYFMTGVPPFKKEIIHQYAYVDLFPLQTPEGLEYCFKENFDYSLGGVSEDWQNSIWKYYVDNRHDIGRLESIKLFELFCGKTFQPVKEFPFVVKGECKKREMKIDPEWMLYKFISVIKTWLNSAEQIDNDPIQTDLIDYMFSIFPYIDSHKLHFVVPLPASPQLSQSEKSEINDTIAWCKRIHEFLKVFAIKKISTTSENDRQVKLTYIEDIRGRLDSMRAPDYPQALIDHWEWVKGGGKIRNTPPPLKS